MDEPLHRVFRKCGLDGRSVRSTRGSTLPALSLSITRSSKHFLMLGAPVAPQIVLRDRIADSTKEPHVLTVLSTERSADIALRCSSSWRGSRMFRACHSQSARTISAATRSKAGGADEPADLYLDSTILRVGIISG